MGTRGGPREGAGRKKGFAALEAEKARLMIAQKLAEHFEPIVDKAVEQAKEGQKDAREWLTERAYGKATQSIDLTAKHSFDPEAKEKSDKAIGEFLGNVEGDTR